MILGLVDGVNFLAAFFFGVGKSETRDACRSFFGDDFQAFDDSWHDFVLQTGIQVFGILADNHHIDVVVSRF